MGKARELCTDLREQIVDLHKSGLSLGAISRKLHLPRSSVQTIVQKFKIHGTVISLPRSGRKPKLSPYAERKLVWMVGCNPGTTRKQVCHELEAAGTQVSLSTVKRALHRYGLKGCLARKKNKDQQFNIEFPPEEVQNNKVEVEPQKKQLLETVGGHILPTAKPIVKTSKEHNEVK